MRNPDPPFLELGFHFDRVSGREAFHKLTRTVIEKLGAIPKEVTFRNCEERVLLRSNESTSSTQRVSSHEDVWKLFEDEKRLAVKLAVEKGTKIVPDAIEFVTILPVNSSDPGECGNSVAIWIEGAVFSVSSAQDGIPSKTRSVGLKARSVFVDLVRRLNPTYAAITVDYGLESPCDLRDDPRTYAFRDFYLQSEHFGGKTFQEMKSRFPKADYEDLGCGVIVTTTKPFVRDVDRFEFSSSEAHELSAYVGRIVAMN